MNNIVSSVSDPSFTQTGKGLMTIFIIGLIKIFLGIHFTDSTISIPWLPQVHFENLNNIFYLYLLLVFYATLRYRLHQETEFQKYAIKALSKGIKSGTWGKMFIGKYILGTNEAFSIQYQLNDKNKWPQEQSVIIRSYNDEFPTESFYLIFEDAAHVTAAAASVSCSLGKLQKAIADEATAKKWGNFIDLTREQNDSQNIYYRSNRITNKFMGLQLLLMVKYYQLKFTWQDAGALDLYLPWFCNIGLLAFCLYRDVYLPFL
ncbi:hypothetical protein R7P67_12145 [Vibrio sp. Vb0937]|uniref:hypothetical protein n=1 Tax=unclassified Vibrio TaxID=2614977 RepID=UPI002964CF3E|nr:MULTISPECIES: hypothetical protein [unclassified Vibrio]MDW1825770.1 hypothetical protein [Vibrio sp. Vb0937]MDW3186979.1 hypothetical protein [Vibrio sp. Vb0932]